MALSRLAKEQYAREVLLEWLDEIDYGYVYENENILYSDATSEEMLEIHDIAKDYAERVKELI